MEDRRICKKCLLKEMDEEKYKEVLEKYITGMHADLKADDELYGTRLSVCKDCDRLNEGTCLACGCYVELRAAAKTAHCPKKKW